MPKQRRSARLRLHRQASSPVPLSPVPMAQPPDVTSPESNISLSSQTSTPSSLSSSTSPSAGDGYSTPASDLFQIDDDVVGLEYIDVDLHLPAQPPPIEVNTADGMEDPAPNPQRADEHVAAGGAAVAAGGAAVAAGGAAVAAGGAAVAAGGATVAAGGGDEGEPGGPRSGRTVININGFRYTRASQTSRKTTFRCSFYRRGCPGRCELLADTRVYSGFVEHNCQDGEVAADDQVNIRQQMSERVDVLAVTQLATTANDIWRQVNGEFYMGREHVALVGLSREQVTSRVYRTRRLHYGGDIHGQIEVPPLAMVDGSATMNFFQFHYSYREGDELHRVIGWAHPALTRLLKYRHTTLFIDGTFRCVPRPFHQCVVLMCHDVATNCYVPVFYTLATGRSQTIYWNILHFVIVATEHRLDPESITCDYEAALITAIRDQLPNTTINGCLFHWKQAIRRRIKKLHMSDQEARIAMERGAMDMLTVIPVDQVSTLGVQFVQNYIQRRCSEDNIPYSTSRWREFWTYFSRTWLQVFPVELWNVHGISHAVINRTNNPLERFNRELNAAFSTPHPNLPTFIATIERISRDRVQFLQDVMAGRARAPTHSAFELPTPVRLT